MARHSDETDEMTTYECDKGCGFYKNVSPGPCRLIGCGGRVVAVQWARVISSAQP